MDNMVKTFVNKEFGSVRTIEENFFHEFLRLRKSIL